MIKLFRSLTMSRVARFGVYQKPNIHKMSPEDREELINDLKEAYDNLGAKMLNEDESVLGMFQDEAAPEKPLNESEKLADYLHSINQSFNSYYNKLSPEEQAKRSKDIMKALTLERDYEVNPKKLNQDYQNYSLFNKNLLSVKYSAMTNEVEYDNQQNLEFLGNLHKDIRDRSKEEKVYSYIYKNPKMDTFLLKDTEEDDDEDEDEEDETEDDEEEEEYDREEWLADERDSDGEYEDKDLRLSFQAKFEMFDLFNKGWSVRDLSLRYGCMPNRVRAILYQKRYFFDEVLPDLSFDMLRDLINLEFLYEKVNGVVDYGVDLEEMTQADFGQLQTNFDQANRNVDVQKLEPREQERLAKFFDKKKQPKHDIVTETFYGEGNKGYFIKSLIMNKTRSKHGVSQMFERTIYDSHQKHRLPDSVVKRYTLGPRIAGAKFGK